MYYEQSNGMGMMNDTAEDVSKGFDLTTKAATTAQNLVSMFKKPKTEKKPPFPTGVSAPDYTWAYIAGGVLLVGIVGYVAYQKWGK